MTQNESSQVESVEERHGGGRGPMAWPHSVVYVVGTLIVATSASKYSRVPMCVATRTVDTYVYLRRYSTFVAYDT